MRQAARKERLERKPQVRKAEERKRNGLVRTGEEKKGEYGTQREARRPEEKMEEAP